METVLLVVHLMIVAALIAVVLLQRSEGGALGVGGGGNFLTSRGTGNVLTRTTTYLAAGFFATSIALTIVAKLNEDSGSILDAATIDAAGEVVRPTGTVLDAIRTTPATPDAAPATPAAVPAVDEIVPPVVDPAAAVVPNDGAAPAATPTPAPAVPN